MPRNLPLIEPVSVITTLLKSLVCCSRFAWHVNEHAYEAKLQARDCLDHSLRYDDCPTFSWSIFDTVSAPPRTSGVAMYPGW